LWIFYINILSCGVFLEWEADGNFLTRVSGSEKYSIFSPVGIYIYTYIYVCVCVWLVTNSLLFTMMNVWTRLFHMLSIYGDD